MDVTISPRGKENKLRFGGIAHAARGFWALGQPFDVAAVVPSYLKQSAEKYFAKLGCRRFSIIAEVEAAPNIVLIFDPSEVDDQGYEALLRDEKRVSLNRKVSPFQFRDVREAIVFPGSYDLAVACGLLPKRAKLHIDVAYDVRTIRELRSLHRRFETIFISTSSGLFRQAGMTGIERLAASFGVVKPEVLILKENRGGSRAYMFPDGNIECAPAYLGATANSVGVGDVYDAAYVFFRRRGVSEAVWRAASASSAYAQTTYPDLFRTYVQRDGKISFRELRELGGTSLPWEARRSKQIYLAAPDFKDSDRVAIERAVSSLEYHNFRVRRPVKENGELPRNSKPSVLAITYEKDLDLLRRCQLVFAVPTARDPGTLVEIGLAIEMGRPVVVYDPAGECANTMVIAGSTCYSRDLDICLNAVFDSMSERSIQSA